MCATAPTRLVVCAALAALLAACGSSGPSQVSTPTAADAAVPAAASAPGFVLRDWPEFGLDPQRTSASEALTGVTAANVGRLRRITARLPGTVDSSPVYLHGALVGGAARNVAIVTTSYGRTLALDADSGVILWRFTPSGYAAWAGSSQITNTSPLAAPDRRFVYAASPDGLIHKLALADGREAQTGTWPVRVTRDPGHEKLAAALNIDGRYVVVATGGYFGDAPPYQGHLLLIDAASGRIRAVFNTLCANRRTLITPSTCHSSDSAIWARAGAVVEPGSDRLLLATGNGPFNGSSDFGDSVLELAGPALALRQSFTPSSQERLNRTDTDLGSSGPALLGDGRAVVAGKDGVMRVLLLSRLDGRPAGAPRTGQLGGEVQRLPTPGGAELFTAPAVWRHRGRTTLFVADESGTAAYVTRGGTLLRAWINGNPGSSPVLAGGLLYVYDPAGGGVYVYVPSSPRPIARLPGAKGHWNSPIVVDGHVLEPEGNANDHSQSGTLDIFIAR